MASFTGRLRTFMLVTFFIAMAAIIAMFYYSIKYSSISRLEIEYFGTLNIRKYLHQSASLTNSSEDSASTTLSITSDSINSLQAGLRTNNSQQMFKTKESEIKNHNLSKSVSNSDITNQSADGFKDHKLGKNDEQSGFSTRSNLTHDVQDENLCPKNSSTLVGPLLVNASVPKMEEVEKEMAVAHSGWVSKGGCWKPTECNAIVKMALIIPYRNRYEQLSIFVRHMHPLLRRQNVDYRIFVIEQAGQTPFNRAMLFNIGFNESLKFDQYECFIFHDVDLIPEDDHNEYSCPSSPRHMSVAVDKFNYRLPYNNIFGGAGSFTKEHFELINGFSNQFWGWGGEDDDLYRRITAKELKLKRPAMQVGRYKMLKVHHFRSHGADPNRVAKIKTATTRMRTDGINSLKYTVQQVTEFPLYTLVTADVKDAMKT